VSFCVLLFLQAQHDARILKKVGFNKKGGLMKCEEVVDRLQKIKNEKKYTLHDLSKKLDIQVTTIERWLKTKRMNKLYAQVMSEKINEL